MRRSAACKVASLILRTFGASLKLISEFPALRVVCKSIQKRPISVTVMAVSVHREMPNRSILNKSHCATKVRSSTISVGLGCHHWHGACVLHAERQSLLSYWLQDAYSGFWQRTGVVDLPLVVFSNLNQPSACTVPILQTNSRLSHRRACISSGFSPFLQVHCVI